MAKDLNIQLEIKAEVEKARRDLASISGEIKKMGSEFDRESKKITKSNDSLISSFKKLAPVFAGAFVTHQVVQFWKSIIQLWWQLEQTKVAFTTMLWGAEEANRLLRELSDFAAKTPFEINWIRQTTKQLLAYGIEIEKILPTLKSLWDVSAGLSVPIEQIAYAYGQVRSANQLLGTELRQFVNAWVPLLQELASMYGVNEAAIKKMTEQGKISFADVEQAFKNMSGEWGRFFDLMDKQSETLLGKWSNLQDSITRLKEQIGIQLAPVVGNMIDQFNDWLQITFGTEEAQRQLAASVEEFGEDLVVAAPKVIGMIDALRKLTGAAFEVVNVFNTLDNAVSRVFSRNKSWSSSRLVNTPRKAQDIRWELMMSMLPQEEALMSVQREYEKAQNNVSKIISSPTWWGGGWRWNAISATKKAMEEILKENKDALEKIKDLRKDKMDDISDAMIKAYWTVNDLLDSQKDRIKSSRKELVWLLGDYTELRAQTNLNIAGEVINLQDQLKEVDKQIESLKSWYGEWSYIDLLEQKKEIERQIKLGLENTTQWDLQTAKDRANESQIERIIREAKEQKDILKEQIKEVKSAIEQEQESYSSLYNFKVDLEQSFHSIFKKNIKEQISLYDKLISKANSLSIAQWWWAIAWQRAMWGPVSAGKTYLVGERWPELFIPRNWWSIIPNNKITNNTPVNITVNVGSGDPQQIAEEIERVFTRKKQLSSLWIV